EYKSAIRPLEVPLWNFMYGDSSGSMYYVCNARVHDKDLRDGRNQERAGWQSGNQWRGVIPFDELPGVENPASGFLMNTNVMPWNVTIGAGLNRESIPASLVDPDSIELNGRGKRAMELLASNEKKTLRDALAIATDLKVPDASSFITAMKEDYEQLARAGHPFKNEREIVRAFDILQAWDQTAGTAEAGMTILAVEAKLQAAAEIPMSPAEALDAALGMLKTWYGTIEIPWGEIHRLKKGKHDHAVGGGTRELPALWMADGPLNDGKIVCDFGSSFTMLVRFCPDGRTEAFSIVPYGSSERPDSSHFADQMPLKSRGELKRAWFDRSDIEAHSFSKKVIRS
ncbi:MAG: penicillin acylase family protein, partial [bacterium]